MYGLQLPGMASQAEKGRSRLTLGQYIDTLKLIKIHRHLDSVFVPRYVADYVIYHEMVHAVCPAYVDAQGITRIHTAEFKKQEKRFVEYDRATRWLLQNRNKFFTSNFLHSKVLQKVFQGAFRSIYGRSQ